MELAIGIVFVALILAAIAAVAWPMFAGRKFNWRPKPARLSASVVILLAVFWFAFVWPTPWRYFKHGSYNIRVNRFTGKEQTLSPHGDGWN